MRDSGCLLSKDGRYKEKYHQQLLSSHLIALIFCEDNQNTSSNRFSPHINEKSSRNVFFSLFDVLFD
jgi:hypothetical protein